MLQNAECIILAGGLGTRLRDTIGDLPKCMAPVAGKPFLEYLLHYAIKQGVSHVVLSLGHKSEIVIDWLQDLDIPLQVDYVIEEEPLGTGGGIRLAMEVCSMPDVFVLNGDTMFDINLQDMYYWQLREHAETTIALKPMTHFDRYGVVRTHPNTDIAGNMILAFQEKEPRESGDINGGIYCINREAFLARNLPKKFSFEKGYLEKNVAEQKFYGYSRDAYFIDIGVPKDYEQAQVDFQTLFPA